MIKLSRKDLNLPNLLTLMRVVVIIPFLAFFFGGNVAGMLSMLVLSAMSDMLDGFLARKLNQVTDVGKMLDPIADKLTHVTISFCLAYVFHGLIPLFILFLLKEGFMLAGGIFLIRRKIRPAAAKWYGKVTTISFYLATLCIVVSASFLPQVHAMYWVSVGLVILTCILMIFTFIQYTRIFLQMLRENKEKKKEEEENSARSEDLTA
jgi:cardiolipin synthase